MYALNGFFNMKQYLIRQLMDDKIQKLLSHTGHIGSSEKIKPMESFSINFNYCPTEKQNDPDQTCFYCSAETSRLNLIWNNADLEKLLGVGTGGEDEAPSSWKK